MKQGKKFPSSRSPHYHLNKNFFLFSGRKRKLLCKCLDELKDENSTNKINCSQASTCTQGYDSCKE